MSGNKADLEKKRTVDQAEAEECVERQCNENTATLSLAHAHRLKDRRKDGWTLTRTHALTHSRNHATTRLSRYAKSVGAKHFHTSARMNRGIDEMFLDMAKRALLSVCMGTCCRGGGGVNKGEGAREVESF